MVYCQLDPKKHISMKFIWNSKVFIHEDAFEVGVLQEWQPFCLSLNVSRPGAYIALVNKVHAALAITPSHQQNKHDFDDGRKNMNDIFNN